MAKSQKQYERFYYMPLTQSPSHKDSVFDVMLGCVQEPDRDWDSILRGLKRAKSGNYSTIVYPANSIFRDDLQQIIDETRNQGFAVVVEVNSLSMHLNWSLVEEKLLGKDLIINILLENYQLKDRELVDKLKAGSADYYYTLLGRQDLNFKKILEALGEEEWKKLYWYFPYSFDVDDPYLTVEEIYRLMSRILKEFPRLKFQAPRGIDIWDPRVDPAMDLESLVQVFYSTSFGSAEKEVSVVIPTYNNRDYVVNTVRHLFQQDLDKEKFEVIVVDDGSDDGSQEALINFAENFKEKVNFKYIFYPRHKSRAMGDSQYRAGVSRNLGVKHAEGNILSFLDSDILTPKNFLSHLIEKHKSYDLVQCRRPHLKREVSSLETNYDDIVIGKDTFVPEGGYWEKFYDMADASGWMNLDNCWKYVCTHTLSLKRQLFKDLGWFRKNYIFYGFEDTDLGLRAYRSGCSLHLSECEVYHLFHKNERSEFQNSSFARHLLLQKTARVFFHNWLDPDIFVLFEGMLRDELSLKRMVRKIQGFFGVKKKPKARNRV